MRSISDSKREYLKGKEAKLFVSSRNDDDDRVSLPLSHLRSGEINSSRRSTDKCSTRLTREMRLNFVRGITSKSLLPTGEKNRITILFFTTPAQEKQINSSKRKITSVLQPIHMQPWEKRLPFSSRFPFLFTMRRLIFNDIREVSFSFCSLVDDDKLNADRFYSFSDWLIVGLFLFV